MGIVDTGNTCITIPKKVATAIVSQLRNQYQISCQLVVEDYAPMFSEIACRGSLNSYPDIYISINGQKLILKKEDYIHHCNAHDNMCWLKLESAEQHEIILLGASFMETYYTIFDLESRRIGFAKNINNQKINYEQLQSGEASEVGEILANLTMYFTYSAIAGAILLLGVRLLLNQYSKGAMMNPINSEKLRKAEVV